MPLVKEAGIDPIYFGVMFIINCSIGLITPPIGNVLNVISGWQNSNSMMQSEAFSLRPGFIFIISRICFIPDLIILPLKWIN